MVSFILVSVKNEVNEIDSYIGVKFMGNWC